jgi:TRAP-type C4-dicarboxylate transport system permease small subunit
MLETVIAGLILAAVSGLTFLAYKHPKGYRWLSDILIVVLVVVCALFYAYRIGFSNGYQACFKAASKVEKTYDIPISSDDSVVSYFSLTVIACWVFLTFLRFLLPRLTEADRKDNINKDEPPKPESP